MEQRWRGALAVDRVIEVLEQLAEVHEQLIECAETKKAAIIANDIDALSRVTASESRLIARIAELDRQRHERSVQVFSDHGFNTSEGVTLNRLYGVVFNPDQRARLQQAEARLRERLERLRQLNDLNQQLLKMSIDYVNFSIEVLSPQRDDDYIYRNPAAHSRDYMRGGLYNTKV
jgi:flagellar biosynthesis/type III secretory pathway chaperone